MSSAFDEFYAYKLQRGEIQEKDIPEFRRKDVKAIVKANQKKEEKPSQK